MGIFSIFLLIKYTQFTITIIATYAHYFGYLDQIWVCMTYDVLCKIMLPKSFFFFFLLFVLFLTKKKKKKSSNLLVAGGTLMYWNQITENTYPYISDCLIW